MALLLASIGIYGVLAYAVSQRRREIGVRIALGASQSVVYRLILRQGMLPAFLGLMVGLLAAYGLVHLISGLLSGVQPYDPITFGSAAATLMAASSLACWIPARRAARVDPGQVLRMD